MHNGLDKEAEGYRHIFVAPLQERFCRDEHEISEEACSTKCGGTIGFYAGEKPNQAKIPTPERHSAAPISHLTERTKAAPLARNREHSCFTSRNVLLLACCGRGHYPVITIRSQLIPAPCGRIQAAFQRSPTTSTIASPLHAFAPVCTNFLAASSQCRRVVWKSPFSYA